MKAWITAVRLRVRTRNSAFGRTIFLSPGLNIVRAGNNRGKTQIVQGAIYGLGMERMLQARAHAPLGSALTSEIIYSTDDGEVAESVISSWVAVEMRNDAGEFITAQRFIKHPVIQRDLVRLWEGAALSGDAATDQPNEYFLHAAGSVQGDRGFHTRLLQFLRWELPAVVNYAGQPTLLYPDVVFPFLIVDQQAWVSSGPRKVDRYQIRNPVRRAAEFLLTLDGPNARRRREELERELADLLLTWASARAAIRGQVSAAGGRVVGLPEKPAGATARAANVTPSDLTNVRLQIVREGEWLLSDDVITSLDAELQELVARTALPSTETSAGYDEQVRGEIANVKEELNDVLAAARLLEQDLSIAEAQLAALDRRLDGLTEERDRNRDVATLIRLGSEVAAQHIADHNCPTCRQSLDGVEVEDLGPTLNVNETIGLLNAQIATAKAMRDRSNLVLDQSANAYSAMQREVDHLRVRLRALEADAIAPDQVPRSADIARRITVELRRGEIVRARDSFDDGMSELVSIAAEAARLRNAINRLPDGYTDADLATLREVQTLMRNRLQVSGFGSYDPALVQIDRDSLHPVREGFDVDTDASASDVVRIKIAYLDAIRQIGRRRNSHPGFLILDEPRQQDMELPDYESVLRYLAEDAGDAGQVVVTSTTDVPNLRDAPPRGAVKFIELGSDRILEQEEIVDSMEP
ncbi:hypothetical protein ACQP00_45045 [Dactylosporangium sp. CS-047395]|uniref:hypothetical protein n=1 Tax=Dactylosporangium sp. CS-047395 TaxID=3239936 RepID=UPI003D90B4DA